jgi:hypothetical protein
MHSIYYNDVKRRERGETTFPLHSAPLNGNLSGESLSESVLEGSLLHFLLPQPYITEK